MFSIGWAPQAADSPGSNSKSRYQARPPRQQTCLTGTLVYGDGLLTAQNAFTHDCGIQDMSEGGARVALAHHSQLPPTFYLMIVKYCIAFQAELAWSKFSACGFRFCRAYPLDALLPDKIKFLRALWGDLYVPDGRQPASGIRELV